MGRWEYKSQLFIALFSFFFVNICSICSIYFVISTLPSGMSVDGITWDIWMMGFLYGFIMLPMGVDHLFSDEFWLVSYRRVIDGSMDPYFLRPVPVVFQVYAETFQPEGFGELIVGIIMLAICIPNVHINWSFAYVLMMIVATIFGAVIITSLKIMFAGLAFKIKRSGPLFQIVYNFLGYTKYPIGIYPTPMRIIFTFILPFAVFVSMPVNILFGDTFNPYILCLIIIGAAAVMFALALLVWTACAKRYESTGN